jgi:predicted glycoside hydrolase/deacetylase ChbG (UPF0249 family)
MKLIIRADDYGYTMAYNIGTIETIKSGVTTSVDLMLDTPGTEDAIERIKEFPWISIGWHAHFWGVPVANSRLVPSMIDESGKFKFRKNAKLKETIVFEEALIECRAEIEKCIRLLGKAPDTTWIHGDYPLERARRQVCDEYGIKYGFARKYDGNGNTIVYASDKYKELNIDMPSQQQTAYKPLYSNLLEIRKIYDPVKYFIDDIDHILESEISISAWHPWYLDDYILGDSSFTVARPKDVGALCSIELKQWIKDNNIELINHRDAIYGTKEYQNHLKVIDSELAIKK